MSKGVVGPGGHRRALSRAASSATRPAFAARARAFHSSVLSGLTATTSTALVQPWQAQTTSRTAVSTRA
eukprot:1608784-Pyramimonas_sp.AAC.1